MSVDAPLTWLLLLTLTSVYSTIEVSQRARARGFSRARACWLSAVDVESIVVFMVNGFNCLLLPPQFIGGVGGGPHSVST